MACRWLVLTCCVAVTAVVAGCTKPREPAEFSERGMLPSCGQITLDQGEQIPADTLRCLDDAFDTGAELAVTFPTVEGDPIVRYYRVGPGIDGLEIFDDTSQDRFGAGRWNHMLCPGTVTASEPLNCQDL
ncbi:MAG: hypothetical protein M3319_06700 [Actinomycetota bacterium]|nr:hypothetical protein [Actinomycetota bacterium]